MAILKNQNKNYLIKNLLKYNIQLGNKKIFTNFWMHEYIFGFRFGRSILNLEKSIISLRRTIKFIELLVENNGIILFINTKRTINKSTKIISEKYRYPYIIDTWIKGSLTNWTDLNLKIKNFNKLILKDKNITLKIKQKFIKRYSGLFLMKKLPNAIFVFDPIVDSIAINEAKQMNIPVIALVDSNSSSKNIDFPIFSNNDSLKSINFITLLVDKAIKKGKIKKEYKKYIK